MTRVLTQGTFDLLHPGHLHYLRDAATRGDELHVVIAREPNISHKPAPVIPAPQRREVVNALEMVDEAHLGGTDDMFAIVEKLQPNLIVLGHDQHHNTAAIEQELERRGIDCAVKRASGRTPDGEELLSTGAIIDRILETREPTGSE